MRDDDTAARSSPSAEALRITLDQVGVGISHLSPGGKILWANPYYCQFLGYTLDELRQIPVTATTHPGDVPRQTELIRALLAGETATLNFEKRFRRKDGTFVWGNLIASAVRDSQGTPQYCVGVTRDITERKEAEARILLYQRQLEDAEEIAQFGSWERDLVRGRLTWSSGGYRLFGFRRDEAQMTFEVFLSMVHAEDRNALLAELKAAFEEKRDFEAEYRITRKDGVGRILHVRGRLFLDEGGVPCRTIGTMQDVTTLREQEKLISEQRQIIVSSDKLAALGEMAADIAHEINSPLGVIKLRTALLRRKLGAAHFDRAAAVEDLEKIDHTIGLISKIIDGLRNLSRSSDQDPMQPARVSQIIDETLAFCSGRLRSCGVELRVKLVDDVLLLCRAAQLAEVLLNLLNNSCDAIESLAEKWIEVEVSRKGEVVAIGVTDSGAGIAEEVVGKMMQPFYSTKGAGKGTGLGLSISTSIVQAHGGRLSYDTASPHTRFVIELPSPERR